MPSARKTTHPIMTKNMVYAWPKTRDRAREPPNPLHTFSTAIRTKYSNPQAKNVQFAPCQIPVKLQTTNKFRTSSNFDPTLDPPKEI